MESLRDIRQNIKAIKSTQQIMQTMKMISNARIRKAQEAMQNARPFAQKMLEMVDDLKQDILSMPQPQDGSESWAGRIFINKTANPNKIGLIVITGDKGLTGSFNAVNKKTKRFFSLKKKKKDAIFWTVLKWKICTWPTKV